jgi:hypothetical protein
MTEKTQQDFLKDGKAELGLTWDQFADMVGIERRALKTYRMPCESKDYRTMNKFVFDAIARVLQKHQDKPKN